MIEERVKKVVSYQFGLPQNDHLKNEETFANLGADSLDQVELEMALEDEFGMRIPDGETDGLATVQDVVNYVTSKVNS